PRAGAVAAERLRDRRDDPDLPGAVLELPPLGDLAAVQRLAPLDPDLPIDQPDDPAAGPAVAHPPPVGGADVHELDVAERHARALEVAGELHDLVLVDAALDDAVDLDRHADRLRRLDALEHARDREVDVVHRLEDRVVERVEADRDALEPGVL